MAVEYTNCFLVRGITPTNKCSGYDTKHSDARALRNGESPSLPALPGPLWSGVVASDRALSMGQIELNCDV